MQIFFTCSPNIIYSYRSTQRQKSIYLLAFSKNVQTLTQMYLYTYTFQYIHSLFGFFTHPGLIIHSYSTYDPILLPFFLESLPDYLHFQPFPFSFSPPTFISVPLCHCAHPLSTPAPHFPSLSLSHCDDDIIMKHISQ